MTILEQLNLAYTKLRELLNTHSMKATEIYSTATALLGRHLTLNTAVPPEEGCAEAVSSVLLSAGFSVPSGGLQGVNALIDWMLANGFKEVDAPAPGDVITAHSPDVNNTNFAHTGIMLKFGIASNNSFGGAIGKFTENYTIPTFTHFFHDLHGSEIRYFSAVD